MLVHMTWQMRAKMLGKELHVFSTVEAFLKVADNFSRDTEIYIDGNLGNGLRGEIESKKIADLGFSSIAMATGEEPETIKKPDWIRLIQGKSPPW